jgi:tetratricopeptide (TPR) repeat protein
MVLDEADRLLKDGDAAGAERIVRGVLAAQPGDARALYLGGKIERLAGRYEAALELLERAAEAAPEHAATHLEIANLLRRTRDFERCLDELSLVLYYDPDDAEAYFELGSIHRLRGDLDRAILYLKQCIEKDPAHARAYTELGWVFLSREQFDKALEVLEKAAELEPRGVWVQNNLGYSYVKLEDYDRALEMFTKLCAGTPKSVLWPRLNLATSLDHTGQFERSEKIYDQILQYEPNNFSARWNRAHILLGRCDFARGWSEYEYRLQEEGIWYPRLVPFEPWKGEPLQGKSLVLSAEQGLGDQIMFASCVSEVAAQAEQVILECDSRLAPLFQRSFPKVRVIGSRHELNPPWLKDVKHADYHLPAGSLPGFFRRTLDDFPPHAGYLRADAAKVERWRARLDARGPQRKIGLSWRGGTRSTRRMLRSLSLADLMPILGTPGCSFVSLQYGEAQRELDEFRAASGIDIAHWQEAIDDYDETAALCAALDLTVSVCTAVIHLNGALGRPVWIMVPTIAEWRYGQSGERMPWYPSARLFRQQTRNVWEPVLATVAAALRRWTGEATQSVTR